MIDHPAALAEPPALVRPVIVTPSARQVSYGVIQGRLDPRSTRVVLSVDGHPVAEKPVAGERFRFRIALPSRVVTLRVTAFDAGGASATRTVDQVFGLPRAAIPAPARSSEDAALARRLRVLVRRFPGTAAVFVQDVRTGHGAAWNARARFPAASTLKVAIALEILRVARGLPHRRTWLATRLRKMIVDSSNRSANELETWLGGSTSGGAARVNATMRALGLTDSHMYGGYILGTAAARPIPLRVESQPAFGVGKYTTAWDMARLHRYIHLASVGRGPLLRLRGSFTVADARYLLFLLARVRDGGKLDRNLDDAVTLHKAGWITTARHDTGLVVSQDGAFVAAVMTWRASGVGRAADELAGRVARSTLARIEALRGTTRAPVTGHGPSISASKS